MLTLLDVYVSSLRRGRANILCIVPMLVDDPRREFNVQMCSSMPAVLQHIQVLQNA